jgi:hypothetical protein
MRQFTSQRDVSTWHRSGNLFTEGVQAPCPTNRQIDPPLRYLERVRRLLFPASNPVQ